jgi:hypothetical protein
MVRGQHFPRPLDFLTRRERLDANVTQQILAGWPFQRMVRGRVLHPASGKNPPDVVQRYNSKYSTSMFCDVQSIGAARALALGKAIGGADRLEITANKPAFDSAPEPCTIAGVDKIAGLSRMPTSPKPTERQSSLPHRFSLAREGKSIALRLRISRHAAPFRTTEHENSGFDLP